VQLCREEKVEERYKKSKRLQHQIKAVEDPEGGNKKLTEQCRRERTRGKQRKERRGIDDD